MRGAELPTGASLSAAAAPAAAPVAISSIPLPVSGQRQAAPAETSNVTSGVPSLDGTEAAHGSGSTGISVLSGPASSAQPLPHSSPSGPPSQDAARGEVGSTAAPAASSNKLKIVDANEEDGDQSMPSNDFFSAAGDEDVGMDTMLARGDAGSPVGVASTEGNTGIGASSAKNILMMAHGRNKAKAKAPERPKPGPKRKKTPLKVALEKLIIQAGRKDPNMYFAEPVPIEEVPGYAEVIKQPMDFGTIRSRVESSCYLDAESFIADMQLVTSNAMEFNPPESSYYQTAERIRNWFERAAGRELSSDVVITPRDEEEVRKEALRKEEEVQRNLAMGLRADGRPKKRQWKKDQLPENYVPAAFKYGVGTAAAAAGAGVGGSTETTTATGTPKGGRASTGPRATPRDGRSITPGRKRVSASPFRLAGDETGGASPSAAPEGSDEDDAAGNRSIVDTLRRRLGGTGSGGASSSSKPSTPRGSLLRGRHSQGGRPRVNADMLAQSNSTALPLSYLPDGSIDPSDIEDAPTLLLGISGAAGQTDCLFLPTLESTLPLSFDHADKAQKRKQVTEAFEAALLTEPGQPSDTYSHDLSALPPFSQHLPYSLPTKASGPWTPSFDPEQAGIPLFWPLKAMSVPGIASAAATATTPTASSGKGASGSRKAAGASSTYSKDFDWTYGHLQPRVRKLLSVSDLGTFSTVVPARAISDAGQLSQYHYLNGPVLRTALSEEMASLPSMALKLPDVSIVPPDLTHLIWTNMYREYRPQMDDVLKSGLKESMLLRSAVFGDALGEAYARSVADFVAGASKGVEERYGPEADIVSEDEDEMRGVSAVASESQAAETILKAEQRSLKRNFEPSANSALAPDSPAPKKIKVEEDCNTPLSASATASPSPAPALASTPLDVTLTADGGHSILDRSLPDWVRDYVIDPLTNYQLPILNQVAAGFQQAQTAQEWAACRSSLARGDSAAGTDAGHEDAPPSAAELQELLETALRGDNEQVAAGENGDNAHERSVISLRLATVLAESLNDPSPRMRLAELQRILRSRLDLSELIVSPQDLLDTPDGPSSGQGDVLGQSNLVIDESSGERLLTLKGVKGAAAKEPERLDAALRQYAKLMVDISRRQREPQRRTLMDGLRVALLFFCIKNVRPQDLLPIPKQYAGLVQAVRNERPLYPKSSSAQSPKNAAPLSKPLPPTQAA